MNVHRYGVYGVRVLSDLPLGLPQYDEDSLGSVECVTGAQASFAHARRTASFESLSGDWYKYALLDDGASYVRWDDVGEFLVGADGRRIVCRREDASAQESFQVYLLGQALSFALVKQHLEPLHATTVVVNGEAVAFLGSNGYGKSSLAASFVAAGYPLLTDDLLIVRSTARGVFAYPGPPRIKLFSKMARQVLGGGDGPAMNGWTDKRIVPLDEERRCSRSVPLGAIYAVAAPRVACRSAGVSIAALSPRDAFQTLLQGTFNRRLTTPDRLERQFGAMADLAARVPMKTLVYPRALERLSEVRDAVIADLTGV